MVMAFEVWLFTFWWFRFATEEAGGPVKRFPNIEQPSASCESCILGKHHREKFISGVSYREKSPLEMVHKDL